MRYNSLGCFRTPHQWHSQNKKASFIFIWRESIQMAICFNEFVEWIQKLQLQTITKTKQKNRQKLYRKRSSLISINKSIKANIIRNEYISELSIQVSF